MRPTILLEHMGYGVKNATVRRILDDYRPIKYTSDDRTMEVYFPLLEFQDDQGNEYSMIFYDEMMCIDFFDDNGSEAHSGFIESIEFKSEGDYSLFSYWITDMKTQEISDYNAMDLRRCS